MIKFSRWFDAFGALCVVGFLAWLAAPSSLFVRAKGLSMVNGNFVFVRETPLGAVHGRWWSDISVIDENGVVFECNSGPYRYARYQRVAAETITYEPGEWASRCIEIGPPFIITTQRQVMLFNLIPLRPARTISEIAANTLR